MGSAANPERHPCKEPADGKMRTQRHARRCELVSLLHVAELRMAARQQSKVPECPHRNVCKGGKCVAESPNGHIGDAGLSPIPWRIEVRINLPRTRGPSERFFRL